MALGLRDRVWAGQAAVAGGPQAASNRLSHSWSVVPAFGQVQGEVAAAVAGGAGRDVDEVAADGGAAGPGVGEAGQGAGGAQQVAG